MKTCELFRDHTVLSFEIFPPKPTSPEDTIYRTLDGLRDLHPDLSASPSAQAAVPTTRNPWRSPLR